MTKTIVTPILMVLLFLQLFFTSCSDRLDTPYSETRFALGTTCTITVYRPGDIDVVDPAFLVVEEIEALMSAYLDNSEISGLNNLSGEGSVSLSEDTWLLLDRAKTYAELSGGAFDPTIGPLVDLWGIGEEGAAVPTSAEIESALALVDYRQLSLIKATDSAELSKRGMKLDLGAIAKGYAADKAAEVLKRAKVPWAIINFGGNVLTLGDRFGDGPWRIGIQDPEDERGAFIAVAKVVDKGVVTSGKYERFFVEGRKRYHHILSTIDGMPIENGIASVTAISADATEADAFSTLLFTLGLEEGIALARRTEGLKALFVMEDGRIVPSEDPEGWLTGESDRYAIVYD
jgi:FAD:protein FMN transferase